MENEKVEKIKDLLYSIYSYLDCYQQSIDNGVILFSLNLEKFTIEEKTKKNTEKLNTKNIKENSTFFYLNKQKELVDLIKQIHNCSKCELSLKRINTVPGVGPIDSKIMIIGEAPGEQEDIQGLPFVGKAGQLLTKLLVNSGLPREKIYITNCLKCRPPNNRPPLLDEMKSCSIHLIKQLNLIKPKLIISLGATSIQFLLQKKVSISKIRGNLIEVKIFDQSILVFPTFHPSFLLRDNTIIPTAQKDFDKISLFIKNNKLI